LSGLHGRVLLERALAVDPAAARALGARVAAAALAGRDKLVLRPPPAVARLADWIEQLVAESTGKGGRGIIPVVDDPVAAAYPDGEIVTDFSADPLRLGARPRLRHHARLRPALPPLHRPAPQGWPE